MDERKDFFTIENNYGPLYALVAVGRSVIAIDSGASRSMFANKVMFRENDELKGVSVYTASGEAIPVLGRGRVGRIPNCLHVPFLEKDLTSVPQLA